MAVTGWLATLPVPTIAAAAVLTTAYGAGSSSLRILGIRPARGTEPLIRLAVGLGILAVTAFLLGILGLFGRVSLILVVALVGGAAAFDAVVRRRGRAEDPTRADASDRPSPLELSIGGALFLFGFAYASLPPYFYDAVVYHLALPARYLASGWVVPPADLALGGYPQNAEMLSAIAMSLGGELAAQQLNYMVAWAGIAGLWWFLRTTVSPAAAGAGALIVIAPWPFWFISTCVKNDLLGALFLLAAFLAVACGRDGSLRRLALAGALAGLAVGTKYTNGLSAVALLFVVPFVVERGTRLRAAALFALGLTLSGALWPARNAVVFENPVYPILAQEVGTPGLTERGAALLKEETGQNMDRSPAGIARRLTILGVDEAAFGWGSTISPILLPTMLLGAFVTRRRDLRFGLILGTALLIVGVSLLTVYVRTFAFAWCLGALAPAALLERAAKPLTRRLVLLMFGLGIVSSVVVVPLRIDQNSARGSKVFRGLETPAAFVERHVNYHPLALGAMRELPEDAVVLIVGSTRAGYLPRVAEWSYVWDEAPVRTLFAEGRTPEGALAALHARGITHLLLNGPEMARNERVYDWLGLQDPAMREWFTSLVSRLSLVAQANDCYLYALPAV
jgi:hypothetical protein